MSFLAQILNFSCLLKSQANISTPNSLIFRSFYIISFHLSAYHSAHHGLSFHKKNAESFTLLFDTRDLPLSVLARRSPKIFTSYELHLCWWEGAPPINIGVGPRYNNFSVCLICSCGKLNLNSFAAYS